MKKNIYYVPKLLVKQQLPHPEFYGEILVELLNGMITDVYTNEEDGSLFTITKDKELIKYLSDNKLDDPFIEIENKELKFRTLLHKDKELVLKWFNSKILNQYNYGMQNIIEFISHTTSSLSHQFIISHYNKDIGLFGYSITGDEVNFNFNVYNDKEIAKEDESLIFQNVLNYIDSNVSFKKLSTLILEKDYHNLGLFFDHGFVTTGTTYLPISEKGYKKAYVIKRDL